ncbi:MAG: HEPN domain-containing protein [Treponema sp.]|jgi:HEPN domain-containing protein|nr:HEPN domain-containing protein [Treponema sp.]
MADIALVRQWIFLAEDDLRVAQHLEQTLRPTPFELICFHCQQAAEKYLKSCLEFHDEIPPKTHDLIELNNRCKKYSAAFGDLAEACQALTAYGVQPRYTYGMELEYGDTLKALQCAEKVKMFLQKEAPELFKNDPLKELPPRSSVDGTYP